LKHNENTYRGPLFTQVSEVSPNSLPAHNGTETSIAAAEAARTKLNAKRGLYISLAKNAKVQPVKAVPIPAANTTERTPPHAE